MEADRTADPSRCGDRAQARAAAHGAQRRAVGAAQRVAVARSAGAHGPWQSISHHFNSWRRTKVFEGMLASLQMRLDAQGHIDWDLWCVDGSTVRASRAAAGAGKKRGPKSPATTPWASPAADSAASATWLLPP